MIHNFGARAHDFGTDQLDVLLDYLITYAIDGVQLAPLKMFKQLGSHEAFINGETTTEIMDAFRKSKKSIPVLGCYLNHAHPNLDKRNDFKAITRGYIDVASQHKDLCGCVATESFTLNGDGSPHKEDHSEVGYKTFLREISESVAYAEAMGVDFAVEPAHHHIIYDMDTTQRLLEDVASPRLKLIFDPCNLMTEALSSNQERFFYEFLERFGSKIVTVHVKDFEFVNGRKVFLSAGEGALNYEVLYRLINEHPTPVNAILEGFKHSRMQDVLRYLKRG